MQCAPVGVQHDALPRHAGSQAVRIEFTLKRCELFAFWLSERAACCATLGRAPMR
jgi:hypothetical protein